MYSSGIGPAETSSSAAAGGSCQTSFDISSEVGADSGTCGCTEIAGAIPAGSSGINACGISSAVDGERSISPGQFTTGSDVGSTLGSSFAGGIGDWGLCGSSSTAGSPDRGGSRFVLRRGDLGGLGSLLGAALRPRAGRFLGVSGGASIVAASAKSMVDPSIGDSSANTSSARASSVWPCCGRFPDSSDESSIGVNSIFG